MKRMLALSIAAGLGALWFVHRGSPPGVTRLPSPPTAHDVPPAPRLEVPAVTFRAADEWQGMAIDDSQQICDSSERCGLATACIEGRCGGCTADPDCATGEACVLDHCVRSELVMCRSRAECKEGELCVLSGISPDARGNSDMRAYCQGATVDIAQSREMYEANQRARVGLAAPPREVTPSMLLDTL